MSMNDNDGQIIFGDLGGLKLHDICLTGEEKPRKNPPRKPVPTGDRTRARCVTGQHAAAWPTAVDWIERWNRMSNKGFSECFGKWIERWNQCVT